MQGNPWNWANPITTGAGGGQSRDMFQKRFIFNRLDNILERLAPCPWPATSGSSAPLCHEVPRCRKARAPLYSPQERSRRDSTPWTMVQGILAPIQFTVFLVSLGFVLNYLSSGRGYEIAAVSIVIKTLLLYAIMITGSIWEKEVFGKYLFAPAFFWEDVVSMAVLALHTAYLAAMVSGWGDAHARMLIALAAYACYALNATQFILKLRAARLQKIPAIQFAGGSAR